MLDVVSSFFRLILPEPVLKWLRGPKNKASVRRRFFLDPWDRLQQKLFFLRGGTYIEWYAQRIDMMSHNHGVTSLAPTDKSEQRLLKYLETGIEDLVILRKLGLQPTHMLHEIGLGAGRSAQFLIDYLEANHYSGNDISKERVRMAREVVSLKGLDTKQPQCIVNRDNTFDWLEGRKVDFIWANSVFGHMPPEDVEDILRNLRQVMHEGTQFYYTVRGADPHINTSRWSVKDWARNHSFWEELAGRLGYAVNLVDVALPPDYVPKDARLMRMVLAR